MSGISLGSPSLSWVLVVLLAPPGESITSSCARNAEPPPRSETKPLAPKCTPNAARLWLGEQGTAPLGARRWIQPHHCQL